MEVNVTLLVYPPIHIQHFNIYILKVLSIVNLYKTYLPVAYIPTIWNSTKYVAQGIDI